ncbi:MAG: TolC family outer membrane protein [Rhodospirillales bacterium]
MILRFPKYPGFLVFTLFLGLVMLGEGRAQTIEDALTAAYLNNPTLLGQRAKLRATDEQVPQALSNWRPSVEITGSAGARGLNNSIATGTNRGQHRDPRSVSLALSQSLYRGGRTLAATRGAENTVKAERHRLLATEQNVLLDAATSFLNVFRDEAVLKLNINNEQVLKRQLEATRDRFEVGEITRTDVHQAEARVAGAAADRIEAVGNLEASRAAYRNVVGKIAPRNLKTPASLSVQPSNQDEANKAASRDNPTLLATEFDEKALSDNVDLVRGELLPELSLDGELSRKLQSSAETGRIDSAEITLNMTMPLYQQGEVYSRLREAKQGLAEQIQVVDQARRDAIEKATSAWEALVTARARVTSFKAQIDANVVALEGVQREAQVGSRTVLDVLDAEQELLDSRVSHVRAQRDELVAVFQVKEAIGALTVKNTKLRVTPYDPAKNYTRVRNKWFGASSSDEGK